MYFSHQSIPLDSINFSPEWNLHPWEFGVIPTELQENFTQNGIIHPPLVIANSENAFTIVSGARRLEFVRRFTNSPQIHCLVIKQDTPHHDILTLLLADHNCGSQLSLAEKARFVEIACRMLKMGEMVAHFQQKLQIKNGRSTIPSLLKILQQKDPFIKEVHEGRIQERMVFEILSLPEETDRLALVQLFKDLGMGDGKQKRFFNLIRDIAFRQGSTICSYLQKKEIADILQHKELNIPQKIQHFGNLLQQEINPKSSDAESRFVKQLRSLELPANHSISHSPSFEKDEITLSITFKNFAACEQYLNK